MEIPRNPLYMKSSAGYRLAYEWIGGTLPAVVFLGGYRSDMYGTKGKWLAAHCRDRGRAFLRLDYSGHGMSEGRFEDGTIGSWTRDALEVIGAHELQRMVLVGSSMGGWIMLLAALELADRVEGLLGIAAAPDFTRDLMWNVFDEATRSRIIAEGSVLLPSQYDESGYRVSRAFIEDGGRRLLLDNPIPLRCPVRLMHGRRDPDVPWQTAERIEKQLESTDVTVTYYKDGDHRLSEPGYLEEITWQLEALLGKQET